MLEILLAYTYAIIIGSIVELGSATSGEPDHTLPAVSESVPVDGSHSKVGSRSAADMEGGDAELDGPSHVDTNNNLSNQTIKEEVSSLATRPGPINDVFQEKGATQDESDFERWAK
mgnify:FL=1